MKFGILLIALLAASSAHGETIDRRPTDFHLTSKLPLDQIQACVARFYAKRGRVTPVPLPDGIALDYQVTGPFSASNALTVEIRHRDGVVDLTTTYQHPWSAKQAKWELRHVGQTCFPDALPKVDQ